jgi:hypothetical protein
MIADLAPMVDRRYAQFHAGAVSFRRRGILLPGPRRCGKSVLTLGLLLKGGLYVSEDVAVLEHRSLRLMPYGDGVSLRSDALSLFPEVMGLLTGIPADQDDDPYQQVAFTSPDRLGTGISLPCRVGMIVFPTFAAGVPSSELVPLSAGQAVLRLLENGISLGADTGVDRGLDVVIALAKNADSYSLRYCDARDASETIVQRVNAG